jgi:DHA3 family macrolide efflux protein-like MFS transporter
MNVTIRRNLALFLFEKIIAVLGTSIYSFAIGLFVLSKTGSSINFAITLLVNILPRILLSPLAGTLSDRWKRKNIIIASNFSSAIWISINWFIFTFITQEIWLLYIATAALSVLNTFYSSAVSSSIYNMVGSDNLQRAMSLNQAVVSFSSILGPVLGGVFLGVFSISIFMVINIFTFIISGIASILIKYDLFVQEEHEAQKSSLMTDLKMGFTYIKKQTFLLQLIFISLWINFWFSIFDVMLPYLVLTVRGMKSFQLGIIEGTFSVGMMLMGIYLTIRAEIAKKDVAVTGGVTSLSIVLILFGLPNIPSMMNVSNEIIFPYLLLMALFISSIIMFINIPVMVLMQKVIQDEYRGRVMSLLETGASVITPLGYLIFGTLLEKIPVWILLLICGLSILTLITYYIKEKTFLTLLKETDKHKTTVLKA